MGLMAFTTFVTQKASRSPSSAPATTDITSCKAKLSARSSGHRPWEECYNIRQVNWSNTGGNIETASQISVDLSEGFEKIQCFWSASQSQGSCFRPVLGRWIKLSLLEFLFFWPKSKTWCSENFFQSAVGFSQVIFRENICWHSRMGRPAQSAGWFPHRFHYDSKFYCSTSVLTRAWALPDRSIVKRLGMCYLTLILSTIQRTILTKHR